MIKPLIFQLPSSKIELVNDSKISYSSSEINAQPLFKYGFHHYINQSKDKLIILNNTDIKDKTFYNIIENYDDNIPNYDKSIKNINKKLFGIEINKDKLELWEILTIFGVSGNIYVNDEDYDSIIKSFYSNSGLKYKSVDDYKKVDTYINLNKPTTDIKQLEQNHFVNIIESISEIGEGLNKNGDCIIKIYDTYTETSIKLLKLLSEMFEESYIYKPFMSYGRDSTKYFIGLKYKNNFKNASKLNDILKNIKNEKLNNIFNDYLIPTDFEFVIKFMNILLGNYEHKMINILVDYIKKSNYFGDIYHSSLENQKKTSELWIEHFCSSNYKKAKENLNSLIIKTIKENNNQMNEMFKLLI
jgi:23S rRNA U2552 (ribose-2'-O)-methylase RlmE/FtsJ